MNFTAHAKLFDQPDPRRLDLRASISDIRGDWLVRTFQQPTSITLHVLLDISASMRFGTPGKLAVATDFLTSLGISAHAYGDAISLLPFDQTFREDLYLPPRRGQAVGAHMASFILDAHAANVSTDPEQVCAGLEAAVDRLEGSTGMVFLISDFHWPLESMNTMLDKLSEATVVPVVLWDKAEVRPPETGQWLVARDLESGKSRQLWINGTTRQAWIDNVNERKRQLTRLFARHDSITFFLEDAFVAEKMSLYFMEQVS